tara:strand:- start:13333 stop:13704 length:372 start_codon:yes stop_codon:yes gene_type:complete
MQEKSLKHSQAKESRKKAPRRRGFLKMFGFLGAGAVVGTASAPAQAGLFDSLLSIVKKILKAAVAGIALFYAWRFLMHSGEAIKGWLEKQIENDKKITKMMLSSKQNLLTLLISAKALSRMLN